MWDKTVNYICAPKWHVSCTKNLNKPIHYLQQNQ